MHLSGQLQSIEQIRDLDAAKLISWTLDNFDREKCVLSTGFGMEGCALIDMASRQGENLTVHYLDTGFFFPETYEFKPDRFSFFFTSLPAHNYTIQERALVNKICVII